MSSFEKMNSHVFVTKLAGFEHSEYIQPNETRTKKSSDDIPLVQGKNIRNGLFVEKFDWYIKKEISLKLDRSRLTKNSILIPYVGSNLGEVGIFYHKYDCHLASNIAKIELTDDYFDLEFLKYYLQSNIGQSYLFRLKQGSAQPNITMEAIRNTLVLDVNKSEQIKISRLLKCIDDKISNNENVKEKIEEYNKTLFERWFLQAEFPLKNGMTYKSSGGKLKRDNNMDIPDNWSFKKISEISNLYQPETISESDLIPEGKYYVFGANGVIGKYDKYNHEGSEIAITCRGNSCGNILMTLPYSWITGNAMVVSEKKGFPYKEYIYSYLLKTDISRFITGSAQPQITRTNLSNLEILVPEESLMKDYCTIANKCRIVIEEKTIENDSLKKYRNWLLNLYMNGQIKIED